MVTGTTLDPREIALEGSVNFRDLGGLETTDGARVRTGQVFRSDALHGLTSEDLNVLADYGIAVLVDLRDLREIDQSGPSPLLGKGVRHMHSPLLPQAAPDRIAELPPTMDVIYASMLDNAQPQFGTIFQSLAESSNLPAVIHCAAGKDRTGVTVAILLRLLGVSDDVIVLDYALTDRNMTRLMERLTAAGSIPADNPYPASYMRAEASTMDRFLRAMTASFGTAEDYLLAAGVSSDQITTIRQRLLDPA